MPIIKSAIKKLRHDRVRTAQNKKARDRVEGFIKKARKGPNPKTVSAAFSALDKAAKRNSIHKNKAARLKSRLAKRLKKS